MANTSLIAKAVERYAADFRSFSDAIDTSALRDFLCEWFGESSRQHDSVFAQWLYGDWSGNELVFCEKDGKVVGTQGAMCFETTTAGRRLSGACAIDLRVRPEWKMKGLGVALIGRLLLSHDVVLGLGISDDAVKMFERQGWTDLGRTDRFLKPMRARGLESSRSSSATMILRAVGSGVTAALAVADAVLIKRRLPRDCTIEQIDRFLPQHDAVLEQLNAHHGICIPRRADYLNWRYFGRAARGCYTVIGVYRGGAFVGYAATMIAMREGKRVLALVDLQCNPEDAPALLRDCVTRGRRARVDVIFYQGINPRLYGVLRQFLFIKREGGLKFMAYTRHPELKATIADRSQWSINLSDSDSDFALLYEARAAAGSAECSS